MCQTDSALANKLKVTSLGKGAKMSLDLKELNKYKAVSQGPYAHSIGNWRYYNGILMRLPIWNLLHPFFVSPPHLPFHCGTLHPA